MRAAVQDRYGPPEVVRLEEASTLPHSAVLAVQGLRLRNGRTPRSGDRVCVVGASGNVGPFAVQIAKAMGAEVTGVASTDKPDMVRSLDADHVIDYTTTDYTAGESATTGSSIPTHTTRSCACGERSRTTACTSASAVRPGPSCAR